ncbi:hypothetical protein B0H10DRAFT_2068288 [Mycena sp. CBHHK59/15]|nr:hypothetical protein B0H10DRAFT_2068288 [Mycena sp. CBHHK59/15]
MDSVPDEILSEIISPLLKLSDEVFSDNREKPLLNPGYSSSTYLLVCKDWLRVSTPLLYHTVMLRTTAQTDVIAAVLRTNESFGLFIKKLRVEGGFGQAMHTILATAPKITDIFVTLTIWASDNTTALSRGLRLINPRRVIVTESYEGHGIKPKKNKQVTLLFDTLVELIPKWENLAIFEFPYVYHAMPLEHPHYNTHYTRAQALAAALAESKTLETLVIPLGSALPDYFRFDPRWPALKVIRFKTSRDVTPGSYVRQMVESDVASVNRDLTKSKKNLLVKMVEFPIPLPDVGDSSSTDNVDDNDSDDSDSLGEEEPASEKGELGQPCKDVIPSSFTPMQSVPRDVSDAIWKRILFFAMATQMHGFTAHLLPFVLVSKTFKEIALPYLYRAPILKPRTASSLTQAIKAYPERGAYIRWLRMPWWGGAEKPYPDTTIAPILAQATRLETFGDLHEETLGGGTLLYKYLDCRVYGYVTYKQLEMLGQLAGRTLLHLGVNLKSKSSGEDPAVLARFSALRLLVWGSTANFNAPREERLINALGCLESLVFWKCSPSFLSVLTGMGLNALRTVSLPEIIDVSASVDLLRRHGSKLHEIAAPLEVLVKLKVFDVCTHLVEVVCLAPYTTVKAEYRVLPEDFLSPTVPQPALIKIFFRFHKLERQHATAFKNIFASLDTRLFPALREIQFLGCTWPTSDGEMANSNWVKFSDMLRPKGIKLTNLSGVHWTPRPAGSRK